jgi:hypothetical protein
MSFISNKISKKYLLMIGVCAFFSVQSLAEIYQWVDSKGRPQFSDSPSEEYKSSGYAQSTNNSSTLDSALTPNTAPSSRAKSAKQLESIAQAFKEDRLKRENERVKQERVRAAKNKKREKKLALAKKRKLACKKAKTREDLAFRKRTQRQGLMQMRKALANYEKKRDIRREKCK